MRQGGAGLQDSALIRPESVSVHSLSYLGMIGDWIEDMSVFRMLLLQAHPDFLKLTGQDLVSAEYAIMK